MLANEKIKSVAERFQILQHAFVYSFDTVVIAIADAHAELIRSIAVDFDEKLIESYREVAEEIKNFSLAWIYDSAMESNGTRKQKPIQIPEEIFKIAEEEVPEINGREALQGTANLWHTMCCLPTPFPSFLRLIPAIYAFWNAVKGGSDTTTKIMDACLLLMPHVNCETAASMRVIMLLLVTCHRLCQVFTAKKDLDYYLSLLNYRNAANKRRSFHQTLLECNNIFRRWAKEIKDKENVLPTAAANDQHGDAALATPPRRPTRRLPNRRRVDGILPDEVTFGPTLQTKMPRVF